MAAKRQQQHASGAFHVPSALSGFSVGAVITLLATVMVVDGDSPLNARNTDSAAGAGYEEVYDDPADIAVGPEGATGGPTGGRRRVTSGNGGTSGGGEADTGQGAGSSSGGVSFGGNGTGGGGNAGGSKGSCDKSGTNAPGVSDSSIKLGATVAEGGVAESFLGEVRQAMEAVRNRVNAAGGICGRKLEISYKNDDWDPGRGKAAIENLIVQEKVFALAVSPSSEGVNAASEAGTFEKYKVPVVGTDGLIRTQYSDPYIWPVATATTTTAHIIMKEAWDRGAREPAIVFENTYRFGVEGALAFNNAYKRLSGKNIPGFYDPTSGGSGACAQRFCGIPASDQTAGYTTEVNSLNASCGQTCDFMVLLLEPKTAQTWMGTPGAKRPTNLAKGMAAAQPLFTYAFGVQCGDTCDDLKVWTGYKPYIEQFRNDPAVAQYVKDLKAQKASADEFNQFTQGGYLGMQLLVEALERVGGRLSREALVETLDSMELDTGLSPPLKWSKGNHFANPAAQAFSFESKNGFKGFRFYKGFVTDPWLGQDAG